MSKLKKLGSMLLALVFAIGMTCTALAVDITINDGDDVTGASYAAYKLMDVTTATTSSGSTTYSYTVNSFLHREQQVQRCVAVCDRRILRC